MSMIERLLNLLRPQSAEIGRMQIHLLAGDFESEFAARKYCYVGGDNTPEQLTRDQPDAMIDTDHVEVSYGNHGPRLAEFLDPETALEINARIAHHNTLIIIAEPAFGGLPYSLQSTVKLDYLGTQTVDT